MESSLIVEGEILNQDKLTRISNKPDFISLIKKVYSKQENKYPMPDAGVYISFGTDMQRLDDVAAAIQTALDTLNTDPNIQVGDKNGGNFCGLTILQIDPKNNRLSVNDNKGEKDNGLFLMVHDKNKDQLGEVNQLVERAFKLANDQLNKQSMQPLSPLQITEADFFNQTQSLQQ